MHTGNIEGCWNYVKSCRKKKKTTLTLTDWLTDWLTGVQHHPSFVGLSNTATRACPKNKSVWAGQSHQHLWRLGFKNNSNKNAACKLISQFVQLAFAPLARDTGHRPQNTHTFAGLGPHMTQDLQCRISALGEQVSHFLRASSQSSCSCPFSSVQLSDI